MAVALPPPTGVVPIVPLSSASWSSAASKHDEATYRTYARMTFTPALPAAAIIELTYPNGGSGVGYYDLDYRVEGATDITANKTSFVVPAGTSTFDVPILVAENLDASETYALTIIANAYVSVGATPTHTITCTRNFDKPVEANTGYQADGTVEGDLAAISGTLSTPNTTYDRKLAADQINIEADNLKFTRCGFYGHGQYFWNANKVCNGVTGKWQNSGTYSINASHSGVRTLTFEYCTFGDSDAFTGEKATNECDDNGTLGTAGDRDWPWSAHFIGPLRDDLVITFYRCRFVYTGKDVIKMNGGGYKFIECYIDKGGVQAKYADDNGNQWAGHCDIFQYNDTQEGSNIEAYRCNLRMKISEQDAAGYASNSVYIHGSQLGGHGLYIHSCWVEGGNNTFDLGGDSQGCVIANNQVGEVKQTHYRHSLLNGAATGARLAGNKALVAGGPLYHHNGNPFNNSPTF